MKVSSVLKKASAILMTAVIAISACGCQGKAPEDNTAEITVNQGDILAEMTIQIGEETGKIRFKLFPDVAPVGVENFVTLAENGYYDGKTIHRVIEDFMIQGGSLRGDGAGGTTANKMDVPRETNDRMRAYYGALGYAESSMGINSQFFIVNNKKPFDINKTAENIQADLEEYKDRLSEKDKKYYEDYLASLNAVSDDVKAKYLSKGGSFSIDGNYTIFGQCIEGFEFIDKISQVEVSSGNDIDDKQGIDSKPTVSITIKKIAIARIPYIDETTTTAKKKPSRPAQTTASSSDENSSDAPSQSDDSAVIITPETTTVADSESEAPESSTEEESSEAEQ
ncbi:MAG: peptidylprolyl isomerase [Ruminiclostridium sp.]|nr:peptidylprolyl isomerase [Ruminiclostridium sp.]